MQPFAYLLSLPGSRETERETLSLFFSKKKKEKERVGSRSIDRNWHASIYLFLARICLHRHATLPRLYIRTADLRL